MPSSKSILVISSFPPRRCGIGSYAAGQVRWLRARGARVETLGLYGDCAACTADCNTPPAKIAGVDTCGDDGDNWCADEARDPSSGSGTVSKLCRQIGAGEYYSGATSWDDTPGNQACKPASGVWSNYQLISTQWINPNTSACENISSKPVFTCDQKIDCWLSLMNHKQVP